MRSYEDIEALAATLPTLTLDDKILFVECLGLRAAYCPQCNCTVGSPYCHPIPEITTIGEEIQVLGCPSPCPADNEEDE